jgi:hypothetical protein
VPVCAGPVAQRHYVIPAMATRLFILVCMIALGCKDASQQNSSPTTRPSDQIDVERAILTEMLPKEPATSQPQKYFYFIAMPDKADPAPDLLIELQKIAPSAAPVSLATFKDGWARHTSDGSKGTVLGIGDIRWIDGNNVVAQVSEVYATLGGHGYQYTLARRDGVWRVTKKEHTWVS